MTDVPALIEQEQVDAFRSDGYLLIPGFYNVEREIDPLRRDIHGLIGLVAEDHGIALDRGPYSPESFDEGYLTLKAVDRRLASIIYDAVKQLTSFVRLMASASNEALVRRLRKCNLVGVVGGGSGIRIDNPGETRYLAWWHQDFPAQYRSRDGVVFWSPLRQVTPDLGPVEILAGSTVEGVIPVTTEDDGSGRENAYALRLVDERAVVSRYRTIAPLSVPGDLLIIDFLTVHRSGRNETSTPRWTVQLRYFNFEEPTGRSIGWASSFASGMRPEDLHLVGGLGT